MGKDKAVDVDPMDSYISAHATPSINLAFEPWLPVSTKNGEYREVGLKELFIDAHLLSDIEEHGPLTRAALRRYLSALTAHVIRERGITSADLRTRIDKGTGFSAAEVDWLIENQQQFLFLYHPTTPFFQDQRLTYSPAGDSKRSLPERQAYELRLGIPGNTEAAWFAKNSDPVMNRGVEPMEAARLLVTRWFYTLAGNEGGSGCTIGTPFISVAPDAAFTQVFRVDKRQGLFATLVRNVTKELATPKVGKDEHPALGWMDAEGPRVNSDFLYMATLTTVGTLLGPVDQESGTVLARLGRTPEVEGVNWKDRAEVVKLARGEIEKSKFGGAKAYDPHVLWWDTEDPKEPRKSIRIAPRTDPVGMLLKLRGGKHSSFGVGCLTRLFVNRQSETEHLELLLGSGQGSSSSIKWSDVVTSSIPSNYFDSHTPRAEEVGDLVSEYFLPLEHSIRVAIRRALARDAKDKSIETVIEKAMAAYRERAVVLIEELLSSSSNGLDMEILVSLNQAAVSAVERALSPFEASVSRSKDIASAIEGLKGGRKVTVK